MNPPTGQLNNLGIHRSHAHAFTHWNPRAEEGLVLRGRRSMLKASLAGMAGLTFPGLLQAKANGAGVGSQKSVILIWMTGGPSHIDTWDPKPDAPKEVRGPFGTIPTALPGIRFCEYLPKQAAMMDRLTVIRSVDARHSNHEPNQVMQTANLAAEPRTNPEAPLYPALASIVARHRGPGDGGLPPYVVLNMKDKSHIAWGGYLGKQFDPFVATNVSRLFQLPRGLDFDVLRERQSLREQFDSLRRELDVSGSMEAMDRFGQQALGIVTGRKAREVFDLSREPDRVRERYGSHEWHQQALLARRLVEAGASFVTIDLSNHSASGTWDTHGDNIPPYGGIWNGLRPLLPIFDHLLTTLVSDLEERGMLDDVLVLAMGEFGRTPRIGTQGSSDGRDHWPVVMSMTMAGGGFRHGQIIGATERDGGQDQGTAGDPGRLGGDHFSSHGGPARRDLCRYTRSPPLCH
ncbi:MAG: DUF1501 domain-containing protein [Planctomycetota bacterium]